MESLYPQVYAAWRKDPLAFWAEAARAIDWITPPRRIFDPQAGVYGHWFPDATCNTCWNAVDRHVASGRAEQAAIIYDSPVTGTKAQLTYGELLHEVATLAAVMADLGVGKGDRVVVYMPMVPEAVIGMLACARIGAIHSVVFGGFAAKELATRIDDAKPQLVLTASCGVEPGRIVHYKPLLDQAIELAAAKPAACLVLQRAQSRCGHARRARSRLGAPAVDAAKAARPACRLRRARRHRSALHPLHVRHDRHAERASCATTAATWWR